MPPDRISPPPVPIHPNPDPLMPISAYTFRGTIYTIVNERPDFRYTPTTDGSTSCYYKPTLREDGTISRCLIGEALFRLGVPDESLSNNESLVAKLKQAEVENTGSLYIWAGILQAAQDYGCTWQQALMIADQGLTRGDTDTNV